MCASRKKQTPGKEVCRFFSRKGWCRYGSSCWFQHGEPAVKAKQSEPEIEIMDRSHLHLDSVEISPNTTYGDLPTIAEWKAMHSSQKIPNTTQRIDHVTLVSGVNRAFVGPHDKEDNKRDQKLLLSLDDIRFFAKNQN
jgi:hypothetical protein